VSNQKQNTCLSKWIYFITCSKIHFITHKSLLKYKVIQVIVHNPSNEEHWGMSRYNNTRPKEDITKIWAMFKRLFMSIFSFGIIWYYLTFIPWDQISRLLTHDQVMLSQLPFTWQSWLIIGWDSGDWGSNPSLGRFFISGFALVII